MDFTISATVFGSIIGIATLAAVVFRRARGERKPFPNTIGEYRFVKEFYHPRRIGRYSFAVYADPSGKNVFAKRWQGWFHDLEYSGLKSDANVLRIISAVITRTTDVNRKAFADVAVPAYLGFIEDSRSATLLIEYVEGTPVGKLSADRRVAVLDRAMAFLGFVSSELRPEERKTLRRRGPGHMFIFLPIITLIALWRRPRSLFIILRAASEFLISFRDLRGAEERVLVHRDLHDMNMMVTKDKVVLIDFQIAADAHPYWELAGTAVQEWSDHEFRTPFLNLPAVQRIVADPKKRALYRTFALYRIVADFAFEYPDREPAAGRYFDDIIDLNGNLPKA